MNPAACARAKKAKRLEREAALEAMKQETDALFHGPQLPATPEEAFAQARRSYRKHTRPFRSAFRGIISRRDAERFMIARLHKQGRAVEEATRESK